MLSILFHVPVSWIKAEACSILEIKRCSLKFLYLKFYCFIGLLNQDNVTTHIVRDKAAWTEFYLLMAQNIQKIKTLPFLLTVFL
jgi:hypothetical protein